MAIKNPATIALGLILILLFPIGITTSFAFSQEKQNAEISYSSVIQSGKGFIALSSPGGIHWISNTGSLTKSAWFPNLKLNSMLTFNQQIIAVGEKGTLLIGSEFEAFKQLKNDTYKNINTLTLFNNLVVLGLDGGELRIGNEITALKSILLKVKGNIVSLSASATACFGVTDKGEIIYTYDGFDWTIFDFNSTYQSFYKACSFTKILVSENKIAVIGRQEDNTPVLYFSNRGKVWTQRNLDYLDKNGLAFNLNEHINDIYYDAKHDFFALACNKGKIITLPSCSHCNKLYELTPENILGISGSENSIIVVGEHGFITTEQNDYFLSTTAR